MLVNQMPRQSLIWVLVAQVVAIGPHFGHLPKWIILAWLLVLIFRVQMFRGVWRAPNVIEKFSLVTLCLLGIFFDYGSLLALEPMVAVLVVAFLLKLLEMKQRSELMLVIFIGFFVVAAQFLFSSSIPSTLYGLLSLWVLVVALVAASESIGSRSGASKNALFITLQALPLMVFLFVFIPQSGALWAVPSFKNTAKTGVSDSMSPGDFSELGQSNEVAFRVSFDGEIPKQDQLYWRGLVFSYFDGRSWSQAVDFSYSGRDVITSSANQRSWPSVIYRGDAYRYQVTLEASQQPWLYVLAAPDQWSAATALSRDLTLLARGAVTERMQYKVNSSLDFQFNKDRLSAQQRQTETRLPANFNPETQRMALRWLREEGSTEGLVQRLMQLYHEEFFYTLQPPLLGVNSVDEFLWSSKQGFCEHFSSSFVVFMRAAGIPARVVVGYQGGELNRSGNYLIVRQKDAHAWAEVWFEGKGWRRVDPTAAVAPERIRRNLQASLSERDASLVGGFAGQLGNVAWLRKLQLSWDASNYRWQRWVLEFDANKQSNFLSRLLGGLEYWRLVLGFVVLAALSMLPLLVRLWRQRPASVTPAQRCLQQFERKLKRLGFVRKKGEAVGDFIRRVSAKVPLLSPVLLDINVLYQTVVYLEDDTKLAALRVEISKLKVK